MKEKDKKEKRIIPSLPGGFRDYPPEDVAIRNKMIESIRDSFEKFGFFPLETSSVERYEVLTGGEKNINKQIYKVIRNEETDADEDMALRFDLTVPLARFVAANMSNLKFPFRRHQIGRVWRGERQQAGRYKEFIQCDVDIVGGRGVEAEAEVVAAVWDAISSIGVKDVKIRINNRKILNALPEYAEFEPSKLNDVIRVLDKIDKIGWDGVEKELSTDPLNLNSSKIEMIKNFIDVSGGSKDEMLKEMKKKVAGMEIAEEGIEEIFSLIKLLNASGVSDGVLVVDFSLARGLSYYTGNVFETFVVGKEGIGSIASGGRYDDMISRFSPAKMSAVGMSIGFDRLFEIIRDSNYMDGDSGVDVVFLNFDEGVLTDLYKIMFDIRKQGIKAELYVGGDDSITGQISYALSTGARFVAIFGEKEKSKGIVAVKNLEKKSQEEIKIENLPNYLSSN